MTSRKSLPVPEHCVGPNVAIHFMLTDFVQSWKARASLALCAVLGLSGEVWPLCAGVIFFDFGQLSKVCVGYYSWNKVVEGKLCSCTSVMLATSTIWALKCVDICKKNVVCVNTVCIEYLHTVYFVAIVQYSASVKSVPQTVSCVSNLKWPTLEVRSDCLVFTPLLVFGTCIKSIWPVSLQLWRGKTSKPLSNVPAVKITSNCTFPYKDASSSLIAVVSSKWFLLLLDVENAKSYVYSLLF